MDTYLLIATVSLFFQIAVLALLSAAYMQKKKGKFRLHGLLMLLSVLIHLGIVFTVMVPAFVVGLIPSIVKKPSDPIGLLSAVHAGTGTAAAILGLWIVGTWRLRTSLQYCAPRRRYMMATLVIWIFTLCLGFVMYFVFNWQLLFG